MALLVRLAHVHGGLSLFVLDRDVGAVRHELGDSLAGPDVARVHERGPPVFVDRVQVNLLLNQLR